MKKYDVISFRKTIIFNSQGYIVNYLSLSLSLSLPLSFLEERNARLKSRNRNIVYKYYATK